MAGSDAGKTQLKKDLKTHHYAQLYVICGEESYLKEYYLKELKKNVVEEAFRDFNLMEYEGKTLSPETLNESIDSYPAMSEKKLVIVKDFDLFKPPAGFSDVLPAILSDLPDYICLVFFYDVLEYKPDKRMKIYKQLDKSACIAEFARQSDHELVPWIERRAKALNCTISEENASYLLFLCGNSMTNLLSEINKAAAHSTTGEIKRYNIDAVCSRVLEAVIFDLSDALSANQFDRAIILIEDLIAQKNSEVMIFSVITRHLQRLYAAKLCETSRIGEKAFMEMIGTKSPYYAKQLRTACRKFDLKWLRTAAHICATTDSELKGSAVGQKDLMELAILNMAAGKQGSYNR